MNVLVSIASSFTEQRQAAPQQRAQQQQQQRQQRGQQRTPLTSLAARSISARWQPELKAYSLNRWQMYVRAKETRDGELGDAKTVLKELNNHPHMRVFALMHFPNISPTRPFASVALGYENEDGTVFWEYG